MTFPTPEERAEHILRIASNTTSSKGWCLRRIREALEAHDAAIVAPGGALDNLLGSPGAMLQLAEHVDPREFSKELRKALARELGVEEE